MEYAGLLLLYCVFGLAFFLGFRATRPRARPWVVLAAAVAATQSAALATAPLFFGASTANLLAFAFGTLSATIAALAGAFAHGSRRVRSLLVSEGDFRWAGGQTVAPAPASEGFRYRPAGLITLGLLACHFYATGASMVFAGDGVLPASVIVFLPLGVVVHTVVLGALFRMVHFAFYGAPAA